MGITNNLAEIQKDFKVFGLTIEENNWEEFIVGEDYDAFLITKKENYGTKIKELNNSKVPIIVFDKELEKLQDKVLFTEKLEKANKILNKVGWPKK